MGNISDMSSAAKSLYKNPLGIIALFIVLVYGFAALTLGATSHLSESERSPLVWFLVIFPVIVLGTFVWLVSQHHEKLYAPADYKNDQDFWNGVGKAKRTEELKQQESEIKTRVHDVVHDMAQKLNAGDIKLSQKEIDETLSKVDEQIESITSITVDARTFLADPDAIYRFPIAAFTCLSDLTNEVYFKISSSVRPYQYGHAWVLRDVATNKVVQNARMITMIAPGLPLTDNRPLRDLGIRPGTNLVVERP